MKPAEWPIRPLGWAGLLAVLRGRSLPVTGTLSLHGSGLWEVSPGAGRALQLIHAWQAFAWMTLRFHDSSAAKPNQTLELTIWKSGLTGPEWCELCLNVARQASLPGRVPQKESS